MKIYLHLLAAGLSQRFGSNKLMLDWQGKTLLQHSILRYLNWQKELAEILPEMKVQIIITTTKERQLFLLPWLREEVKRLCFAETDLSEPLVVINDNPEEGQSSSIRRSLLAVSKLKSSIVKLDDDAYDLFAVADQPKLTLETLLRYTKWQYLRQSPLTRLYDGKDYGNPCFFQVKYRPELNALEGDSGGKVIFNSHPEEVDYYYVHSHELVDIDLPDDWEKTRKFVQQEV